MLSQDQGRSLLLSFGVSDAIFDIEQIDLATFTVFAVICLGGIAFTMLRVPETTGYSLEAIEKHLNSGKPLAGLRREVVVSVAVVAPLK